MADKMKLEDRIKEIYKDICAEEMSDRQFNIAITDLLTQQREKCAEAFAISFTDRCEHCGDVNKNFILNAKLSEVE